MDKVPVIAATIAVALFVPMLAALVWLLGSPAGVLIAAALFLPALYGAVWLIARIITGLIGWLRASLPTPRAP